VQQYHVARVSQDIDLVCSFDVAQSLLSKLYPSGSWRTEDKRQDDYRPVYEITHRVENLGAIKFGPKITQRAPYEHIDWFSLTQRARPYVSAEGELPNILVPAADGLAFTKLISFLGRESQPEKALADLADLVNLTNHDSFSANYFLDLLRRTRMCDEIMSRFRIASEHQREIVEDSCLFSLSRLFYSDDPSPPVVSVSDERPGDSGSQPSSGTTTGQSSGENAAPSIQFRVSPATSTAFFHDRMCDAFPGIQGLHQASDVAEAFGRLKALFTSPLVFGHYAPLWEVGHGHMSLEHVDLTSPPIVKLAHHRYVLSTLVAYRSMTYWHDFILLEWRADQPTGLYEVPSAEEMEEYAERLGGACTEEYGVWEDEFLSRLEHDDGCVFRDGRSVRIQSRLEVRNLTPGFTFLVGQRSPLNDARNDLARWGVLRTLRSEQLHVQDVARWVESLPLHRRDEE